MKNEYLGVITDDDLYRRKTKIKNLIGLHKMLKKAYIMYVHLVTKSRLRCTVCGQDICCGDSCYLAVCCTCLCASHLSGRGLAGIHLYIMRTITMMCVQ